MSFEVPLVTKFPRLWKCSHSVFIGCIHLLFFRGGVSSSCLNPCTGGDGCPNGGPQAFTSTITGYGSFLYAWNDPLNVTSVDLYQIDLSVNDNGLACSGLAIGAACSLNIPAQGQIGGICDTSTAGITLCWSLGYLGVLVAFPWAQPCDRDVDSTCNTGTYDGVPGVHYYLRIDAGRCCYYSILQTPGCSSCPGNNPDDCPRSSYATTDITAMGMVTNS